MNCPAPYQYPVPYQYQNSASANRSACFGSRRIARGPDRRVAEVVVLDGDAREQSRLVLAADQERRESLRELEVVMRVPLAISGDSAVLGQQLEPVLADGLEQMISRGAVAGLHDDERLVDERGDAVEDVFGLERIADADGLGRLEREAPGEDGESAKQRLLATLEQSVTPVHRAAKRSLAR